MKPSLCWRNRAINEVLADKDTMKRFAMMVIPPSKAEP